MRSFIDGVRFLGQGFGWWRRRPGLMVLGMLPALLVAAVLTSAVATLAVWLPTITDAVTPFADGWPTLWATVLRIAVGTAVLAAALVLTAVTFTSLTLIVGEPFYDRIWRAVETDLGGNVPAAGPGFWRSAADALGLLARGVLVALATAVLGLIPAVGGVLSAVVGVFLTGWLLADELSSRALGARGLDRTARRALLRSHRGQAWGFGVATQLCFLIPLGAVVTMPAAVVGSTLLARAVAQHPATELTQSSS